MLENISEKQIRMWKSGLRVDLVSSTRVLLFGADCDVDEYMSSPALSRTSRKVLQALSHQLVNFAADIHQQGNVKATEVALLRAANSLEIIPSDDGRDDSETFPTDNAASLVQMEVLSRSMEVVGTLILVALFTVLVIAAFIGISAGISKLFPPSLLERASSSQGFSPEKNTTVESTVGDFTPLVLGRKMRSQ
jgi:hypothetical protein